jgi:hypothetical protein
MDPDFRLWVCFGLPALPAGAAQKKLTLQSSFITGSGKV